jgi:hypothetical protein
VLSLCVSFDYSAHLSHRGERLLDAFHLMSPNMPLTCLRGHGVVMMPSHKARACAADRGVHWRVWQMKVPAQLYALIATLTPSMKFGKH